jgi:hypothetical protein
VARPELDLEGVVTAHGHPRDLCRTQVVKGDVLPRLVVRKQLGAVHARRP